MLDGWICGRWEWSREPVGIAETEELKDLLQLCQGVLIGSGQDVVVWACNPTGVFSVGSVKDRFLANSYVAPNYVFEWNKLVPKKVSFVAWRAVLDRLPTFDTLAKRNISVRSLLCPICGELEESVEYVFVSCGLAQCMWSLVSQWCKTPVFFLFSFRVILELHKFSKFPKDKARVFHAVCLIAIWSLWKRRNALVHKGSPIHLVSLVEEIKVLGFLWIKNRWKRRCLIWKDWYRFTVSRVVTSILVSFLFFWWRAYFSISVSGCNGVSSVLLV
ncbi:uncharacterized protein LOC143587302 [Bidens hawaiensis]|uniref:uncharacterized protein LOC143587302 n=1 Tax=Bidens hawaiensis TaxID=980011 RepID=UPI00404B8AB6